MNPEDDGLLRCTRKSGHGLYCSFGFVLYSLDHDQMPRGVGTYSEWRGTRRGGGIRFLFCMNESRGRRPSLLHTKRRDELLRISTYSCHSLVLYYYFLSERYTLCYGHLCLKVSLFLFSYAKAASSPLTTPPPPLSFSRMESM